MARDISGIRERRRRSKARSLHNDNNENSAEQSNANQQQQPQAPKQEALVVPISRLNRLKGFFKNLFTRKPKISKSEKLHHQLTNSSFKPLVFSVYIFIFLSLIISSLVYIINQESKYETKNKRLITTTNKNAPKEEEKTASPLIADDSTEEEEEEKNKSSNTSRAFSAVIDNQTYTIESVIPTNMKSERFDLGGFLNFISNNRASFCKFAEQSRMAYIFANGEVRDYSATSYPLPNNKFDYTGCMSATTWKESELFALYQNIYEDFINTQTEDDALLQKLVAAKNYQMNVNFNPVRDFPQSLSGALLSESNFNEIISGNYANQVLLCDYSQKFAKAYDQFVSKRNGSLRPIGNCYADNMNLQESYVQYVFYHNYVQPNSKEVNANLLHSALIPNYSN